MAQNNESSQSADIPNSIIEDDKPVKKSNNIENPSSRLQMFRKQAAEIKKDSDFPPTISLQKIQESSIKEPIFIKSNPDQTEISPKKIEGLVIQDYEPDISKNEKPEIIKKGGDKESSVVIDTGEDREITNLKQQNNRLIGLNKKLSIGTRNVINLKAETKDSAFNQIPDERNANNSTIKEPHNLTQKSIKVEIDHENPAIGNENLSKIVQLTPTKEENLGSSIFPKNPTDENIDSKEDHPPKLSPKTSPRRIAVNASINNTLHLSPVSPNKLAGLAYENPLKSLEDARLSPPPPALTPDVMFNAGNGKQEGGILGAIFTESEIREAFSVFDLNKDGAITGKEIRAILHYMGEHASDDEIDEMVRMFDSTGRGKITFHDFFYKISGLNVFYIIRHIFRMKKLRRKQKKMKMEEKIHK